jgi:hypothetical protein
MPLQIPRELKDLLRQILCVDVDKRITISGIKAHPAFRLCLPGPYQIPSPLPLPTLLDPIDPAALDDGVIAVLKSIGYQDDEEIDRELRSDSTSMAKVFFLMYTRGRSVEDYPWPDAGDGAAADIDSVFLMPAQPIATEGSTQSPFTRRPSMPGSIGPVRSFAAPAAWGNEPWVVEAEEEQALTEIQLPVVVVMAALQGLLTEQGIVWLHPSDRMIVGRTPDKGIYVELEAVPSGAEQIDLFVRMIKGAGARFTEFVEGVTDRIQGLVNGSR